MGKQFFASMAVADFGYGRIGAALGLITYPLLRRAWVM
jgi:hypothetical protein